MMNRPEGRFFCFFMNRAFFLLRPILTRASFFTNILSIMVDLRAKFLGSMLGSAIGDAIGELAFKCPEREHLTSMLGSLSELCYTDDTAMAIGLAESIIHHGRIDQQEVGKRFSQNYKREPWRGYASGPPTIFYLIEHLGIPFTEAARRLFGGKGSFGNGAAMRIAPVGLFLHHEQDLYAQACASAEITHAHPVGMDGAAVQAKAIALAVSHDPDRELFPNAFIQGLMDFAQTPEIHAKMRLMRALIMDSVAPEKAAIMLGRSVAVHESMPFAIYCFLRHPRSFVECLFCAVLHGGDRDTLGAMACAVSGAYLGIDAIPHEWRENLENRTSIEHLALELFRKGLYPR